MYKDEIKKIEYFKQRLIDQYLKLGKVISKNELEKKLEDFDLKLSIFKQAYIENGEKLDLEKFQEQKKDIYLDLKIIYEIIFDLAKNRLAKTQAKIEYTINYLQEKAKQFEYRNALESIGIFGNTLYYATNGFNQLYTNGTIKIPLGSLDIKSGTYVMGTIGSNEFKNNERVIFHFDDYVVSDYFYNKDLLTILGNYDIKTYDFYLEENTNTSFKIDLDNFVPEENNQYYIFGGKNMIKIYNPETGEQKYIEKIENVPYMVDTDCIVSFYIYGSKKIVFDINDKYDNKSFNGYEINTPKQRQKITIKANIGFILDFSTDGTVYADKTQGYIENKELYSNNSFGDIIDFMIEELAFGSSIHIDNAYVEIKNAVNTFYDINYLLIKETQISELDSDLL